MLTLILGGARSGKSAHARSLCAVFNPVIYLVTARVLDAEMRRRVERHRAERPRSWVTLEEPLDLPQALRRAEPRKAPVIVDCITLWLSNLCWEHRTYDDETREEIVLERAEEFLRATFERNVIAVSNEVGGGIVPESPVGRFFRDLQGKVNQRFAAEAARVDLLVAGIPLTLKADASDDS